MHTNPPLPGPTNIDAHAIDGTASRLGKLLATTTLARPEIAAGRPSCWLVVGFYDDVAVRIPDGWRLSSVKLTLTYQENEALLAATMAAVKD